MKVSVLMATIGSARLSAALDSLLKQGSDVELEIVLVNDSPDFVVPQEIANLDPRVLVLQTERNLGLAGALNLAFSKCSGDVIVRQDDDDESLPARMEKITDVFRKSGSIDIICSWAIGYRGDANKGSILMTPRDNADLERRIGSRNCIIHSTIALTREAFSKLGGYSENFRYAQDYDLYLRARAHGMSFHVLREALIKKNFDPSSVTISRRTNQVLHSLAAQCLYYGKREQAVREKWAILGNVARLFMPDLFRQISRSIRLR